MMLRSEENIKVIQVLLQAEKSHLHLPLKLMTSGLSLNTEAIQSWRPSPITPKDLSSVIFPQLELQLFSFANSTSQLPGHQARKGRKCYGWKQKFNTEMQQKIDSKSTDLAPSELQNTEG